MTDSITAPGHEHRPVPPAADPYTVPSWMTPTALGAEELAIEAENVARALIELMVPLRPLLARAEQLVTEGETIDDLQGDTPLGQAMWEVMGTHRLHDLLGLIHAITDTYCEAGDLGEEFVEPWWEHYTGDSWPAPAPGGVSTSSATYVPADCPCGDHLVEPLSREAHEWLLSIEDAGAVGFADLLEALNDVSNSNQPSPGELRWFEFETFVHLHNWKAPEAMYRFANLVGFYMHIAAERTEAFEQAEGLGELHRRVETLEEKLTARRAQHAAPEVDQ